MAKIPSRIAACIAAAGLLATTPVALAAGPAGKPAPVMTKLPEPQLFTLDNGLRVAVLEVHSAPVVAVQVWYHVGSKEERRDRRGSAHMFEHIMFKGTQHLRPEAHANYLTLVGGYVNAETDEDATHYVDTLPAQYFDYAVRLEAERMRGLLFRPDMIKTEREVVKEEIRQADNSPILKGLHRFLEVAYTKHPYAWTAGGTIADLDNTTPEDLQGFYDTYYQPNNALLVVVGDVDAQAVKTSAQKYFGAIAKAPEPPRPAASAQEPEQTAQRREVVEPSQIGLTLIGYKIPPAKAADIYPLQVAALILGGGESSRIKQRLKSIDKATGRPLALDGGVEARIQEDPGILAAIGAYLDPGQTAAVEAALLDEIAKLGAKGPAADELRMAKNRIQAGFVFSLQDAQGLAEQIGRSWILTGDPTQFLHDVDALEKVTAADVQRVVKQYLAPTRATIIVIPPAGGKGGAQ